MHLAELVRLRTRPGAVVLLSLTARCPLRCAHCSTSSTMSSQQHEEAPFRALVDSFTTDEHPRALLMSGGEPLLRPALVADLARAARRVGTRSCLLSGMFFARSGRISGPVRRAVTSLDHFSASVDAHHEREVGRREVFTALRWVIDRVPAVSLHVTGSGPDDPYVDDLMSDVRRVFGDRVPALVTTVQATGRAAAFTAPAREVGTGTPCPVATWPLVDDDGTVFACSRQSLARRHRPEHLVLGHAARDSWATLRARATADPVLRAVRAVGPVETARLAGVRPAGTACATCVTLPAYDGLPAGVELLLGQALGRQRPRDLARRLGAGRYADLVELGWSGCAD